MQSKAEDEGILAYPKGTRQWAYVEDDNAAMRLPGRRTCLDICLVCYNYPSPYRSCVFGNLNKVPSNRLNGFGGMGDDNTVDRRTISDSTAKTILYVDNPR